MDAIEEVIRKAGFVKEGDCWKARSFKITIVPLNPGFQIKQTFVKEDYDDEFPRLSYKRCECGQNFVYKNRGAVIEKADFFKRLEQLTSLRVYWSRNIGRDGINRFEHGELFVPVSFTDQQIRKLLTEDMENVFYFDGNEEVFLVPPVQRHGLLLE